ncbi:hypothetical protein [Aquisphaera giovannonii]|uniref:hypothetical protein n=1 Tax=Aquisphaera giovannonii TaxID=406548 RepID=UPI00143D2B7A|nr:hypothetical protein [Aquisphaera giovannonii]
MCLAVASASGTAASAPAGDDAGEPIVVEAVHPEGLAAALIGLFDGARAPHPAAALSRWKRAGAEPGRLAKPLEAAIAVFNPEMAPEWKALDGATLAAGLDPSRGSLRWRIHIPHDDGSIASLLTAMRLSGGSDDEPLGEAKLPVERLGSGSAVACRGDAGLDVAASRADLERAIRGREAGRIPRAGGAGAPGVPGLAFRIEPAKLPEPEQANDATRRAVALARGLGCRSLDGTLAVRGDAIGLEIAGRLDPSSPLGRGPGGRAIEPAWLALAPDDAAAVLCLATGDGPGYWDALFRLADRVDRAPPARAGMAPLRTRLALLTAAAGAKVEADLWPHLRGLTLVLLAHPSTEPTIGLAFHMDSETSARVLIEQTLPRLATLWGGGRGKAGPAGPPGEGKHLGRVGSRPLEAASRGSTVVLGWGDGVLAALLDAAEKPANGWTARVEREASRQPGRALPDRVGFLQPGRVRIPIKRWAGPSPLEESLAEGAPLVWAGWTRGEDSFDRVEWADLKSLIRRFLERIPLAPATR